MKELREVNRIEETNTISATNNSAPKPYQYKNRMVTELQKIIKELRSAGRKCPKCDDMEKQGWELFKVLDLT